MFVQQGNSELAARSDLYLFNPANRAFIEGKSPRIVAQRWIGLVILLSLGAIGLTVLSAFEWTNYIRLTQSGIKAQALVTGLRSWKDSDNKIGYSLTYTITASDGKQYQHTRQIDERVYRSKREGDSIEAFYVPDNPNISSLDKPEGGWTNAGWATLLTVVAIGATVYFYLEDKWSSQCAKRLANEGQLLEGAIVNWYFEEKWTPSEDSQRYYEATLHYRFVTQQGHQGVGMKKKTVGRNASISSDVDFPPPGTPLAILYVEGFHYDVL